MTRTPADSLRANRPSSSGSTGPKRTRHTRSNDAALPRRRFRPQIEALESRTLLSTVTKTFSAQGVDQFSGQQLQAGSQVDYSTYDFLGATFGGRVTAGGIARSDTLGDWGIEGSLSGTGKAGLGFTFTASSGNLKSGPFGSVNADYTASLSQDFQQPTYLGQVVTFDPSNTKVTNSGGSFSTRTPAFGYEASLDFGMHITAAGEMAVGKSTSGSVSFGGDLSVPLFSVNKNNSGTVNLVGMPIYGASPGIPVGNILQNILGAMQNFALSKQLEVPLSKAPPVKVKLNLTTPDNLTFMQTLRLQIGDLISTSTELATLMERAPAIDLKAAANSGGIVSASGESTIAQLAIQMGPLAAAALNIPALAAASTLSLNFLIGTLGMTPISFQLAPTLSVSQDVSMAPESMLTYTFSRNVGTKDNPKLVPVSPSVVLNGRDLGARSSITFTPGKDTLGIRFDGPIVVTPTWRFQDKMTNVVSLNASLNAILKIGELTLTVPVLPPIKVGPLFEKNFTLADTKLKDLFNKTFSVIDQTVTGDPFTIGQGFVMDLHVASTGDLRNPAGGPAQGSLRYAMVSANSGIGGFDGYKIILDVGNYFLTLPANGVQNGLQGNLLVSSPNVTILGRGAGLTVIDASVVNDRVLRVLPGAHLTLVNLTIRGGKANGAGGGILQEAGSLLDIKNCIITDNTAVTSGGGISSGGGLTIEASTIQNNQAVGIAGANASTGPNGDAGSNALGGGIYLSLPSGTGPAVTIVNSTIANNQATGGAGGAGRNASAALGNGIVTAGNGGRGGPASGGGIFLTWANQFLKPPVYLLNDTIALNTAAGGSGGSPGNGFSSKFPFPVTIPPGTAGAGGGGTGGGVYANSGNPNLQNTLIAANSATANGQADDYFGGLTTYGNNLIGNAFGNPPSNVQRGNGGIQGFMASDITNVDAKLTPLRVNPRVSPMPVVRPSLDSPAIDRGSNTAAPGFPAIPDLDQRGLPRRFNGASSDIGAVEYNVVLALTGGGVFDPAALVTYTVKLLNTGADPAQDVTIVDDLPAGATFVAVTSLPAGWVATDPGVGNHGTITFSHPGPLEPSADPIEFQFQVQEDLSANAPVLETVRLGPNPENVDTGETAVTFEVCTVQEGQELTDLYLGHFASPFPADAQEFDVNVEWGDGSANSRADGADSLTVVANAAGGFDVFGRHTYAHQGDYSVSVDVGLNSIWSESFETTCVAVGDAPLTAGPLTPPPVTFGQHIQDEVLYEILDTDPAHTASDFTATVEWGDGAGNSSADGTGAVTVVANPAGGFNVVGSHAYAAGVAPMVHVQVLGPDGFVEHNATLFHFTDADPLATAADFTASVEWGDGQSNTSADGSGTVAVVASPAGGFDVVGAHVYAAAFRNSTFSVHVTDAGGSHANASTPYNVGYGLSDGILTPPAVTTLGQSVQNMVLFHFDSADPLAQAGDFTPSVAWGDESTNPVPSSPSDVQLVGNPKGGFDVVGSHTYTGTPADARFIVSVKDRAGERTGGDAPIQVTVPAVLATGGFTVTATEGMDSGSQTVARFTDPGAPAGLATYDAAIDWGDSTSATQGAVTADGGGFVVHGNHTYAHVGTYNVVVTVHHTGAPAATATSAATVSGQLALPTFPIGDTGADATVTPLYQTILGRMPATEEVTGWAGIIKNGASIADVAQAIWSSEEHRLLQIDSFYSTLLHRDADAAGEQSWLHAFMAGASETDILQSFLTSSEYLAGHSSDAAFLDGLYHDVLGRTADDAGKAEWLRALSSNHARADVARAFLMGSESLGRVLDQFYTSFLGRSSDQGVSFWVNQLQKGNSTFATTVASFLSSSEFQGRLK